MDIGSFQSLRILIVASELRAYKWTDVYVVVKLSCPPLLIHTGGEITTKREFSDVRSM
jgi:hypothetical protein